MEVYAQTEKTVVDKVIEKAVNAVRSALQEPKQVVVKVSESTRDELVVETKQFRVDLDTVLQELKAALGSWCSAERVIAVEKLTEAIMWLGMDLKALGEATPYPNSYNPENTVVDPTADGLKL